MPHRVRGVTLLASRVQFPSTTSLSRVPPSHIAHRSFAQSRILRNSTNAVPSRPAHPITPPISPTPATSKSRLRYFRLLRFVPYKTIIAITLLAYGISKADVSMKDSIEAILAQFTVPENTWLYLNLNELHITDSPHSERALQLLPFVSSQGKRRMTILEITSTLIDAGNDPHVKGLVLAFNPSMIEHRAVLTGEVIESHLGMGALNEIGRAIKFFADIKRIQRKNETPKLEPKLENLDEPETWKQYQVAQDVIVAIADNYCILP